MTDTPRTIIDTRLLGELLYHVDLLQDDRFKTIGTYREDIAQVALVMLHNADLYARFAKEYNIDQQQLTNMFNMTKEVDNIFGLLEQGTVVTKTTNMETLVEFLNGCPEDTLFSFDALVTLCKGLGISVLSLPTSETNLIDLRTLVANLTISTNEDSKTMLDFLLTQHVKEVLNVN